MLAIDDSASHTNTWQHAGTQAESLSAWTALRTSDWMVLRFIVPPDPEQSNDPGTYKYPGCAGKAAAHFIYQLPQLQNQHFGAFEPASMRQILCCQRQPRLGQDTAGRNKEGGRQTEAGRAEHDAGILRGMVLGFRSCQRQETTCV